MNNTVYIMGTRRKIMGKTLDGMMPNGCNVYISSTRVKKDNIYSEKDDKRLKKTFKRFKKHMKKKGLVQ